MELKKLNGNYKLVGKYLAYDKEKLCNYSLGVLLMWEKEDYEYLEVDDTLILRLVNFKGEKIFLYPMGKNPDSALKVMLEISKKEGKNGLSIMSVSDKTAEELVVKYPCLSLSSSRDWADYIYNASDLMTYAGKRFNGQRNHLNKFIKLYPNYKYKIIEKEDLPRLKAFMDELDKTKTYLSEFQKEEFEKCYLLIENMFEVDCVGGYIEIDGKIIAYCIGEIIGNTFFDHIEKADKSYEGVYQVLVKETAKAFCQNVKYINREEDCGEIGLRTSKMQYQPTEIRNKNFIKIGTPFCKILSPVTIKTERLLIREFEDEDKVEYYNLCTDEEVNKYWGYDYKQSVKGTPEIDYFINGVNMSKKLHEEYPLCVTFNGQFIGEVVLHNFDLDNSVETGIRLKKEFQGQGFGVEALKGLAEYVKNILNAKVKGKCMLENIPSRKMFLKTGYKETKKDDTYYYFEY